MSESSDTRALCRRLEYRQCMTYPLIGSKYAPTGWPDRLIVMPDGEMWLIEFKKPGGRFRLEQLARLDQLGRRGARAAVCEISGMSGVLRLVERSGQISASEHRFKTSAEFIEI